MAIPLFADVVLKPCSSSIATRTSLTPLSSSTTRICAISQPSIWGGSDHRSVSGVWLAFQEINYLNNQRMRYINGEIRDPCSAKPDQRASCSGPQSSNSRAQNDCTGCEGAFTQLGTRLCVGAIGAATAAG